MVVRDCSFDLWWVGGMYVSSFPPIICVFCDKPPSYFIAAPLLFPFEANRSLENKYVWPSTNLSAACFLRAGASDSTWRWRWQLDDSSSLPSPKADWYIVRWQRLVCRSISQRLPLLLLPAQSFELHPSKVGDQGQSSSGGLVTSVLLVMRFRAMSCRSPINST